MYRVGSALLKNVEEAKSKTYTTKEGLFTELSILIKDFEQFATSLIGWSFQIPIAEELRKLVLADGNEDEAIAVLSFPDKENIALTEQQALYAIGAKVQKAGVKKYTELAQEIETDIEEHIKQYGWINARGGFTEEWTPEEIFDRIIDEQADFAQKITELVVSRAESQTKSQALVRELSLSEEQQKTVAIAKELVYFRTYRTDTINQVAFCMQPLLEQVAEYLRITHEAVTSLTVDELLTGRIPAEEVLERRTQNYFSMTNPGGLPVMVDDPDEIAILVQEHLLVVEVEEGHLKGNTAYKGLVCGKVRLLRSKQDIAKVQKGEILVTTMTTPNMIPAMEKAVGFVTDEGGITCHAAIIAREMKKPCVIATKVATKVLKDGDMIELDADNGIVRIFEKG
jgi:phosphohistidine swiveling domain-containing protein